MSGSTVADEAVTLLHREQWSSLVRLAGLLLGDRGAAEEVVQDAFVQLHLRYDRLREPAAAPAWLRTAVVNGARSRLRRVAVRRRHAALRTVVPVGPPAEAGALAADEHRRLLAALHELPTRQRESLVLRFLLDLPEAATASAMGVGTGSVKTHVHRGLATLRARLGEEER